MSLKMDLQNKANLEKLTAEISTIAARLQLISDSAYGDMEGAYMPDFAISEVLYNELALASEMLTKCVATVNRLAQ